MASGSSYLVPGGLRNLLCGEIPERDATRSQSKLLGLVGWIQILGVSQEVGDPKKAAPLSVALSIWSMRARWRMRILDPADAYCRDRRSVDPPAYPLHHFIRRAYGLVVLHVRFIQITVRVGQPTARGWASNRFTSARSQGRKRSKTERSLILQYSFRFDVRRILIRASARLFIISLCPDSTLEHLESRLREPLAAAKHRVTTGCAATAPDRAHVPTAPPPA